tara:strand:- start:4022 stop:5302 length:1281 start_codon:yes stop_codon:yes gene_type:complete
MRCNVFCVFLFYFFVITNITFSQNTTPFSSLIPIGELSDNSFANNMAMGGLGISNGSYWHINNQNPAALVNNRFTTFEMGVASDIRQVINQRSKDNIGDGNLNYIGFAIPVIKQGKWTTSFGFNPYSKMSYRLLSEDIVNNIDGSSTSTLVTHEYHGDGGLTEIYFSNGFKLSKTLSIGIKSTYIFGKISSDISSILSNESQFFSNYFEKSTFNDYSFMTGLFYSKEIDEDKFLKIGLIYDLKTSLKSSTFSQLERKIPNSLNILVIDTIYNNIIRDYTIPKNYGFGISYEILDRLSLGVDFKYQPWKENAGYESQKNNYKNYFQISSGIEIIPNAQDVNNYLNRITYRGGLLYKSYPYFINENKTNNIAATLGVSLPIGTLSRINLGFEFGKRGNLIKNLTKENYLKFIIGCSINNVWFIKRKFD